MKKRSLFICLCLVLISCFTFVGCNNNKNTNKVPLSLDNYSDYIALNLEYSDVYFNEDYSYMYCTATISTHASAPNVKFENVSLTCTYLAKSDNIGWKSYGSLLNADRVQTELSYDGTSKSTLSLYTRISTEIKLPPNSKINDITVIEISGFVIL